MPPHLEPGRQAADHPQRASRVLSRRCIHHGAILPQVEGGGKKEASEVVRQPLVRPRRLAEATDRRAKASPTA